MWQWVDDADEQVLARLHVRVDPLTGRGRPPSERTIRRVLAGVDPQAVQDAAGVFVAAKLQAAGLGRPPQVREREQRRAQRRGSSAPPGRPDRPGGWGCWPASSTAAAGSSPSAPRPPRATNLATFRNLAIDTLRTAGYVNIAHARRHTHHYTRMLDLYGLRVRNGQIQTRRGRVHPQGLTAVRWAVLSPLVV